MIGPERQFPSHDIDVARQQFSQLPESTEKDKQVVENRLNSDVAKAALKVIQEGLPEPKPEQTPSGSVAKELILTGSLQHHGTGIINGDIAPAFSPDLDTGKNNTCLESMKMMKEMLKELKDTIPTDQKSAETREACIKELVGLIGKCFSPVKQHGLSGGSPGSPLPSQDDFVRDWDSIQSKPKTDPIDKVIADAEKQLEFLSKLANGEYPKDWSEGNNLHHEMASVAALANQGQLFTDFLMNPKFEAFHDKFKDIMKNNGMPHIDEAIKLAPKVRGNVALAEVSHKTRKEDIQKTDKDGNVIPNPQLMDFLKGKKALASHEDQATAIEIGNLLLSRIDTQYTTGKARGLRGRGHVTDDVAKAMNPHLPAAKAGAVLPQNMAILTNSQGAIIDEALGVSKKLKDACLHGFSPFVGLNSGRVDPLSIGPDLSGKGIDDPQLKDDLSEIFKSKLSDADRYLLDSEDVNALSAEEKTRKNELKGLIKAQTKGALKAIKSIPFTMIEGRKGVEPKKLSLEQMAANPTYVQRMHHHGFNTICGPSGTTTDINLALVARIGINKMKEIFSPLQQMAILPKATDRIPDQNPDDLLTPDDPRVIIPGEWQNQLKSIGNFMEAGRFHTAVEVLAGQWITSCEMQDPPLSVEEQEAGFERLLQIFANQPSKFLGVNLSGEEAEAIKTAYTYLNPGEAVEVLSKRKTMSTQAAPAPAEPPVEKESTLSSIKRSIEGYAAKLFKKDQPTP